MSQARDTVERAAGLQLAKEVQVGILQFVNETNPGFSGVLKQRFTDFLVNEINLDGEVIHLTKVGPPKLNSGATGSTAWQEAPGIAEGSNKVAAENGSSLSETDAGKDLTFKLDAEDESLLDSYLGPEIRGMVVKLYQKILDNPKAKAAAIGSVLTNPITDRNQRTAFHQDMRRIFRATLETSADSEGVIRISMLLSRKPAPKDHGNGSRNNREPYQQKGKLGWQELGGEHLHFSLYKENRDTMEVINFMATKMQMRGKSFAFAGTKDRRGVTVQRISVHRMRFEELGFVNKFLRGSKIGNFKHEKHGLKLGDLAGNEFVVTLRDCQFQYFEDLSDIQKLNLASQIVGDAVANVKMHGFINYFGLQRFGSYNIGTDQVGLKILQGDFENAVNYILSYSEEALSAGDNPDFVTSDGKPMSRDDIQRAQALHIFKTTQKGNHAVDLLPRKFSAENTIVRHLSRYGHSIDFLGALLGINRNLKLMYVHAYQSLVWNMVASERWARFGNKVIEGDLVIVDPGKTKNGTLFKDNEVDQNGEIIVLPAADDFAVAYDDMFERARPLTAQEADSERFTIFDIVLPTPGYDIEYPANEIGDYYKKFMASDRGGGLDPADMRRPQKDFSLSGSYRKLLAQVGRDMTFEIKLYTDDNEQMVQTDLDRIETEKSQKANSPKTWKSREQNHNEGKAIQELNLLQHNSWVNLPQNIAAEDKKTAELLSEQEAVRTGKTLVNEVAQPMYKDKFIETSAEDGRRTGRLETSVFKAGVGPTSAPFTHIPQPPALPLTTSQTKRESHLSNISLANSCSSGSSSGGVSLGNYWAEREPKEQALKDRDALEVVPDDHAEQAVEEQNDSEAVPDQRVEKEFEEQAAKEQDDSDVAPKLSIPTDIALEEGTKRSAEIAFGTGAPQDEEKEENTKKIAVIVKFQLGSSQYATMALRELMKQGGVQTYKPDFSGGR